MQDFEMCKSTFADLTPELKRMAGAHFRHLDPEKKDEAIQNTLALCWHGYVRLIEQGRGGEPGIIKSVLWYSIRQTKAGRTLPGSGETEKTQDVYRNARRGRVRVERVEVGEFVGDETPIPEAVSFRLDVPAFLATLGDHRRRMALDLMGGMTTAMCAARYGVTPAAVSQFRARFRDQFESFVAG